MPPMKKRRKGQNRRWSRAVRDRPRRPSDRAVSTDYTYDLNAAGEPMLSWAQAQQTVRLLRGQSTERFTIANELPLKYETSSNAAPRDYNRLPKNTKKTAAPLLTATGSFEVVEALQKSVETVIPPPDAQQEAYVCDEEDLEMLKLVADKKVHLENSRLTITCFEETITLLERESMKFRGTNSSFTLPVDEDAVCSVCQKGDCDNTNMILFCDMCNLAVHQECYGVPYIPEGQWHCRRCMVSPSRTVQCILCPNSEGALKQTEDGHWAHVICAMYIPQVTFKSTQLLEPVMNIENIERSRYKLTCCLCKKQPGYDKDKKVGVCIQCKEPSCKVAFHATCAQKAGYHMDLKPAKDDEKDKDDANSEESDVEAIAFCEKHSRFQPQKKDVRSSSSLSNRHAITNKAQQQNRMESLNIESDNLLKIAKEVKLDKKPKLFILILNYWKSKRRHRNGLPLLKRPKGRSVISLRTGNHEELEAHRCMIKSARQQVEKLRTVTEYSLRKDRTDFKRDKLLDVRQGFEVMPAKNILEHVFDRIKAVDKDFYFAQPVTEKIAPKYFSIIPHPMDFSTMAKKLEEPRAYSSFEEFEADVNLIINNCLKYNQPDTIFHEFSLTFREAVKPMLEDGRRDYKEYAGRAREGTSVYQLTRLDPDVFDLDDSVASKKSASEDDMLSEVSTTGDELNGRDTKNAEANGFGSSPVQEDHLASTSSSSATCSSPIAHCRMIPTSPKSRKNPYPHEIPADAHGDSSKEEHYGSARKRARVTSRSSEDNHASSSYVPVPPNDNPTSLPVPTMARTAPRPYRNGQLINIASESELDGVFASEDSTDLPSSDCEFDSDSHLQRPMTRNSKRRLSSHLVYQRQWIDYRPGDMVWAKVENFPTLPGFITDPTAAKGYRVKDGVFTIPPAPPEFATPPQNRNERMEDDKCLVFFRESAIEWAWVPRDKLDFLLTDDTRDRQRLNESNKAKEKAAVRKAFDFAKKLSSGLPPTANSRFHHVNGSISSLGQG